MFVDSVRGWGGRPAIEGAPERRSFASKLFGRAARRARFAEQDLPATHGASDGELVQIVRERAIDGAEKNRFKALMLLYAGAQSH